MNPLKKQLETIAKDLTDESTVEDVIERLHFIAQVEAGIKADDEGRTISHEEMKKRIKEWQSR